MYMNQVAVAFQEKDYTETEPTNVEMKKTLCLRAVTEDAERVLQSKEIEITTVPYNIGRASTDGSFANVDLKLLEKGKHTLLLGNSHSHYKFELYIPD